MAVTSILTTENDIDAKAGLDASASYTETMKNGSVLRGESMVNDFARFNFSDAYAALNADVKYLISDVVSSFVAMEWIAYDMAAYQSRSIAADMVNRLRDTMNKNLSILMEMKQKDFINGA
jgi:hypothetical protein